MGEISQEQYDMLKDIPKDERSKFVAAFERLEKDTAKDYRKYVAIALEKFKALNDIKEKDIIEIAFDAIWLDKEVSNLQVTENIRFIVSKYLKFFTPQPTQRSNFIMPASKGEFKNLATNEQIYKKFEELREILLKKNEQARC